MKARLVVAALLITGSVPCLADAPAAVVYRTPASLGVLPAEFEAALTRTGCRVPQGMADGRVVYTNTLSAELAMRGQTDWAVLCSRAGDLSIEVHWGGDTRCPSSIDLPMTVDEGYPFDQGISSVDAKFIYEHFEAYGGTTPPPITHFGIDYVFYAKGSDVYYCHGGEWIQLTGAD